MPFLKAADGFVYLRQDGACFGQHDGRVFRKTLDGKSSCSTVAEVAAAQGSDLKEVAVSEINRIYVEADEEQLHVVGEEKRIFSFSTDTSDECMEAVEAITEAGWACEHDTGYVYYLGIYPGIAWVGLIVITWLMYPRGGNAGFMGRNRAAGDALQGAGQMLGPTGVLGVAGLAAAVIIGWMVHNYRNPDRNYLLTPKR